MSDALALALLIVGPFALVITAYVTTVYGLALRPPRWRAGAVFGFFLGAVLLFIVTNWREGLPLLVLAGGIPFAVYWAWREKMYVRSGALVLGTLLYLAGKILVH